MKDDEKLKDDKESSNSLRKKNKTKRRTFYFFTFLFDYNAHIHTSTSSILKSFSLFVGLCKHPSMLLQLQFEFSRKSVREKKKTVENQRHIAFMDGVHILSAYILSQLQ